MYTIFKFYTINVNNFSNKVRNFVFQSTQFFKEYIQLCVFNIHNFSFSKKKKYIYIYIHNFSYNYGLLILYGKYCCQRYSLFMKSNP